MYNVDIGNQVKHSGPFQRTLTSMTQFSLINTAYNTVFRPNRLSLGLVVPLESDITGPAPTRTRPLAHIRMAEDLGFAAVWLRDAPFNVPSFGDAGQMFDPFVYLGLLAGQTNRIASGVASVIRPLRRAPYISVFSRE